MCKHSLYIFQGNINIQLLPVVKNKIYENDVQN